MPQNRLASRVFFRSLKDFFGLFLPPAHWRLPVFVLLGIFCGLGIYVFYISNAVSYLSSDSRTCMNCHVMTTQYITWTKGSHGQRASCMDCHVPHDNVIHKYFFKMKDGLRHATIFTMRTEPQVIRIKDDAKAVVQKNCIHCHEHILKDVSLQRVTYENSVHGQGKLCWDCHRETPHGRVRSLAATPYAPVPRLDKVSSQWLWPAQNPAR